MTDSKFSKYFTDLGVDVGVILVSEKFAGCSYVGQFPGGHIDASAELKFRDAAVDVFYQPNPAPWHGHYFSMFVNRDRIYIANADYVTMLMMYGIYDNGGNILYPRFQHDFRFTDDHEYGADGGWWFKDEDTGYWGMNCRTLGSSTAMPKTCRLSVVDGRLEVVDEYAAYAASDDQTGD